MADVDVDGTAHVVVLLDGGEVSREALGRGVTVVAIGTGGAPVGMDPDLCLDVDGSSERPDAADAGRGIDVRPTAGAPSRWYAGGWRARRRVAQGGRL